MPEQLERVLGREAYTSEHLKWNYNDWGGGLIGMKTWLVSLRDGYSEEWRNTYDDCIRMLEEKGGMPSEVDQEFIQKKEEEKRKRKEKREEEERIERQQREEEERWDRVEEMEDWDPNSNLSRRLRE